MINLIKNRCMIGFLIFIVSITVVTSLEERKMIDNKIDNNYIKMNLN